MYAQVEKPKENKSRAVANSVTQQKHDVQQNLGFIDNRPELIAQRKIEAIQSQVDDGFSNPTFKLTNAIGVQHPVVQRGADKIDPKKGQPFKFGLIKGTFVPITNNADMHVEPKSEEVPFSLIDVYKAISHVYNKMDAQKRRTEDIEGTLDWNPQGAAVIKMVVELLGEALGGESKTIAQELKQNRKSKTTSSTKRSRDVLSEDIIPEHMAYLRSMVGEDKAKIKPIIGGTKSLEEFEQNMLESSDKGELRLVQYEQALLKKMPISLSIALKQSDLPALLRTM